jgi:acetylglutamate kinase
MVLGGLVNKEIVNNDQPSRRLRGRADRQGRRSDHARKLTITRQSPELKAPEIIDIGHVGEVASMKPPSSRR